MTRNRASAKTAGTRFETAIVDYLAVHVSDLIERRRLNGSKDRGDISGVRHMGGRVVVECKDYAGRYLLGPWLRDVNIARGNDDAAVGVVVIKRRGVSDPGEQVVAMTMRDLVALLTGERPA